MIKGTDGTIANLLDFPWKAYQTNVFKFLNSIESEGLYPISRESKPTLISTAIAILLKHSIGLRINNRSLDIILGSWDHKTKLYTCDYLESYCPKNLGS